MKHILKYVFIVVGVILFMSSGNAQGEMLTDVISHVLQTNPEVNQLKYTRMAKDQEVVQAKGGYFPTLDVSAGLGLRDQDRPYNDRTWPESASVKLRQNLFHFGATKAEVRRQKARSKSDAYLLQGTSENVALKTARVYLNVLRSLELRELAKENLTNHERIADQMKLRSKSGVDRKADFDQVMGRLSLAQSNIVTTTANIRDAITDYEAVVGRSPENLDKTLPLEKFIPTSMEEAEQFAVRNYPIVKSAKADIKAREAQYEFAKRIVYPSLDIAVDYTWERDMYPNVGRYDYLSATAIVSFNIFNGFRNKGRIQETKLLIGEAKEILNNTERQTIQSVRLSWEAYRAARERVAYLEEYVRSTEATAIAFAAQWNIGRRTMFDLLDTQAEYINAKSDLVKARYDQTYAEYRILSGMGKLVHTMGLKWPEEGELDMEPEDAKTPPSIPMQQSASSAAATPQASAPVAQETAAPVTDAIPVAQAAEIPAQQNAPATDTPQAK